MRRTRDRTNTVAGKLQRSDELFDFSQFMEQVGKKYECLRAAAMPLALARVDLFVL
jgi:hypothetical protein